MGGGELTASLGVGAGTNFADMGKGTTILVAGTDLYNEAPVWYLRIKQAAERGATLILVNPRTTKLERYAAHVVRYAYGDEAETVAGLLKSKSAQAAAEAISAAENLVVLYGSEGMGLEGTSALAAACAQLLVETNHFGRANNGLIGVWPKANDQGAWEVGFRPQADLAHLFKGKVVYIAAADPAGDDPALAAALKEAKFVAVQELFLTATAQLADVVLPAQAYTEREGSFTSAERRVQRFYPAVPVRGEARPDFAITAQIANRAGVKLEEGSALRVMDRLAAQVPAFEGLSYRKLAEVVAQWPIVGRGDLYFGGTLYENTQGLGIQLAPAAKSGEKVQIPAVQRRAALRPEEATCLAVPVTRLYDRGITVSTSGLLQARIGETEVRVHPTLAEKLALGEMAEVRLDGSTWKLKVRLDETVPASVALLPRSMGVPIAGPMVVALKASKGEGGR
jgi:NADH-quinone oxidoreductase subunit G